MTFILRQFASARTIAVWSPLRICNYVRLARRHCYHSLSRSWSELLAATIIGDKKKPDYPVSAIASKQVSSNWMAGIPYLKRRSLGIRNLYLL
jgi:hypothetical protein